MSATVTTASGAGLSGAATITSTPVAQDTSFPTWTSASSFSSGTSTSQTRGTTINNGTETTISGSQSSATSIVSYINLSTGHLTESQRAGIISGIIFLFAGIIAVTFLCARYQRRRQVAVRKKDSGTDIPGLDTSSSEPGTGVEDGDLEMDNYNAQSNIVPSVGHETAASNDVAPPSSYEIAEIEDVDNSSRNKYRAEDFDLAKTRLPIAGPSSGDGAEDARNLALLRHRIDRIREERDRLERIQELRRLEEQTAKQIIEAQRRAGNTEPLDTRRL
jgi:hypothetical protein